MKVQSLGNMSVGSVREDGEFQRVDIPQVKEPEGADTHLKDERSSESRVLSQITELKNELKRRRRRKKGHSLKARALSAYGDIQQAIDPEDLKGSEFERSA